MFDVLTEAARLRATGTPFVLATVVRIEKPTSAKPGAKAIVLADGSLQGWVGGSCAQPTVVRESLKALQDGQPRLLHLGPPEQLSGIARNGLVEVPLTCASEGTLEIYIEPYLMQPQLVLIGHLPVVEALSALGKDIGYEVTVIGQGATAERFPRADRVAEWTGDGRRETDDRVIPSFVPRLPSQAYVVIASHGNYDEPALEMALCSDAAYVALVASQKRLAGILDYLRDSGLSETQLAKLKCPAGLDFGAVTPEEIALSILAEIVQVRRGKRTEDGRRGTEGSDPFSVLRPPSFFGERTLNPGEAFCPTCGMIVEITTALHVLEYAGEMKYFCCPQCKRRFEKTPEKFRDKQWNV